MSIFLCCASRRRGRRSGDDGDAAPPPRPIQHQLALTDMRPRSERPQESVKAQSQPEPQSRDRDRDSPIVSPVLPCEDPAELRELVVDDSDGDGEDGDDTLTKTSSALDVVRTRLIRHMSQENESNRRSRICAGHSQEEIARRAELRRFRHQRIQDELKSEESNDESSNTSHRSTRYLSPLIDVGQPGGGPRDTIEFAVEDGHHLPDHCVSPMPSLSSTDAAQDNLCHINRLGSNRPEPAEGGSTKAASETGHGDQDSPPEMPVTPEFLPTRPPSAHSSATRKQIGCSYKSPRLGRVLGADNEFDMRHGPHAWEEQSALGIWLIAQGLRSRSNSIIRSESELNENDTQAQASSPTADLGGIDRVADTPPPAHQQGPRVPCNSTESLADMGITQQPPEHDSFDSDSFSSSATDGLGRKFTSEPNAVSSTSVPDDSANHGASGMAATRPVDNSSSNYPSVMPSFQPSPNRSQSNVHHLSAEDLESLELSPFSWQGKFSVVRELRASEGKSSYATAEDDTSYSDNNGSSVQIVRLPARPPLDSASPAYSETASFRHREAELRTIEKRFGPVLSRKKPANVSSRFKEEFHVGSARTGRMSLMAKINLSVSRRSKHGSNSFSTVRSRSCSATGVLFDARSENLNGNGQANKPSVLDITSNTLMTRKNTLKKARHVSISRQSDRISFQPAEGSVNEPSLSTRDAVSETPRLTLLPCGFSPAETQRPSRHILHHWTTSIHSSVPNQQSKPHRRLTKPPESWARYPSHTREERIRHVSLQDHMLLKGHEVSQLRSAAGSRRITSTPLTESSPRFLPGKLGTAVRSGLNKLIHTRHTAGDRGINPLQGQEDDWRITANAECPESEMMPTNAGYQEANVTVVAISETKDRAPSHDQTSLSAKSVSCQLSASLEETTLEILSKVDSLDVEMTPTTVKDAGRIHHIESEVMADVFVTPLSRLKFKDENDVDMDTDSISVFNDSRVVLRRWKSTVDRQVTKRASLTWPGQSMTQSLSLDNLRC